MALSKRLSNPLKIFLLFYLLALVGLGSYLFWPQAQQAPLRVTRASLAPSGDRILLEGQGFSDSTQVSLALDVSNRRFLKHSVPTWGLGGDLVRAGRFAYATSRDLGLIVLDLTEPERPQIVGNLALPGRARALTVEAGIAYVACDRAGLALVDVSTPDTPQLMATLPELEMVQGLAVRDGRLYTAIFASDVVPALAVTEVSDPRHPQVLGRISLPGHPLGVAFYGERLFVIAGAKGLLELGLGEGLPRLRSQLPLPASANSLVIVGEHAYVACTSAGLAVIDLKSEPPRLVAQLPLPGNATRLVAEGGRLYIPGGTGGGRVVDIERPDQPKVIGDFPAPRGPLGVAAQGRTVYLNTGSKGVQVLDLTKPVVFQNVAQVDLGEPIVAMSLENNLLVVATPTGKLHLLEHEQGGTPLLMKTLGLKGECRFLQIKDGYVYAHIKGLGLEVVDIRNPRESVSVGRIPIKGANKTTIRTINTFDFHNRTDQVVLVDELGRLLLLGSAESGEGRLLAVHELPEEVGKVVCGDDLCYVVTRVGAGLRPVRLRQRGVSEVYPVFSLPAQQVNQLAVLGKVVLAACGLEGLVIIDFSDSSAPRLLATLPLPISADRIRLVGTSAYVGDASGALMQIDLSAPARPQLGGLLADVPEFRDFAVSEGKVFLAALNEGLVVVPLPQSLQPIYQREQEMTLALPPIDTPGYYTLRLTDGSQTVAMPGALALGAR